MSKSGAYVTSIPSLPCTVQRESGHIPSLIWLLKSQASSWDGTCDFTTRALPSWGDSTLDWYKETHSPKKPKQILNVRKTVMWGWRSVNIKGTETNHTRGLWILCGGCLFPLNQQPQGPPPPPPRLTRLHHHHPLSEVPHYQHLHSQLTSRWTLIPQTPFLFLFFQVIEVKNKGKKEEKRPTVDQITELLYASVSLLTK